jgi:ubiquinone/menaquinone biosynthesis C-methylase UbiE
VPTHKEIYESHAAEYEALISREDHTGNILKSIQNIVPIDGLDVLDLGAGTGRLAALLAPGARSVLAFDLSRHMLDKARDKLLALGTGARRLAVAADHRHLPLPSGAADLIVSGWSVSYVANWYPDTWRRELEAWLGEAHRVLRQGAHIILLESLGTGNESPVRLPHLAYFYDWLERAGFAMTWIRTDYRFETPVLANELASFFFGEEMKPRIKRGPMITLPECTGVWWKQV